MRVLFLTACVAPGNMSFTKLTDVNIRLNQYFSAIRWYLDNTNLKILVVENTNYDMSEHFISAIESGRLEVLHFCGNQYDPQRGKGYGEALILEYGLTHSKLLKEADSIFKITGRLICKNIKLIHMFCRKENVFYAMIRKGSQQELLCDSKVFIAPINYLKIFLEKKEMLNDSNLFYFEHLCYFVRGLWILNGNKFVEPWIPFNILGMSGSTGRSYTGLTFKTFLKFIYKRVLHSFGYYI